LAARYGAGFSETTLQYFRKFYQIYVDRRPQIPRPLGVESVSTPPSTAILPIRRPAGDESPRRVAGQKPFRELVENKARFELGAADNLAEGEQMVT
jgi:hypothetical protein